MARPATALRPPVAQGSARADRVDAHLARRVPENDRPRRTRLWCDALRVVRRAAVDTDERGVGVGKAHYRSRSLAVVSPLAGAPMGWVAHHSLPESHRVDGESRSQDFRVRHGGRARSERGTRTRTTFSDAVPTLTPTWLGLGLEMATIP